MLVTLLHVSHTSSCYSIFFMLVTVPNVSHTPHLCGTCTRSSSFRYFPLFHVVYNISLWWSMQLVNSFFWFHNELRRIFSVQLMFTCRVETQTIKMNRILYIEELTTASIIIILEFSSTARWNVLMIFIFFLRLLDCTFWIISQWPSECGHLHRN